MKIAVLTPIASKLTLAPCHEALKTWPAIQGVEKFYFAHNEDLTEESRSLIEHVPNREMILVPRREFTHIPEYWRKLYRIADKRNRLLEVGRLHDYALFLDIDIAVPPDIIERLIGHGKDIVAGLVRTATNQGTAWAVGKLDGDKWIPLEKIPSSPLIAVDHVGSGCLMLSRRAMSDKRLRFTPIPIRSDLYGGEDQGYSMKAKQLGYECFLDPSVRCEHWRMVWNQQMLRFDLRPLTEKDQ